MRLKHFNLDPGAQIFLACSDVSRLRILNLIFNNGETCVSDLERILDFTQAKTSRHIIYLKNSGILSFRKYNQWIFYHVKDEAFEIIKQILQFISRDPILQKDQAVYNSMLENSELAIAKLNIKHTYE